VNELSTQNCHSRAIFRAISDCDFAVCTTHRWGIMVCLVMKGSIAAVPFPFLIQNIREVRKNIQFLSTGKCVLPWCYL
jgi:hypothetical protein